MASIFISREVSDTAWMTKMQSAGHSITAKSLLEINSVPVELPECDWVFFYSKNGVEYFFKETQAMLAPYKWACMGPKTAEVLQQFVVDVDFIGDGSPETTAINFDKVVRPHERVCYAQAAQSMQSVQTASTHQNIIDLVVYENSMSNEVPEDTFDILAFTSPLNVKAFFAKRTYQGEQLIAIGPTTAQSIKDVCGADATICQEASEEEMLKLIELLDRSFLNG